MNKEHKLYNFISISLISAFIYQSAAFIPLQSLTAGVAANIKSLTSAVINLVAQKPKPERVELKDRRSANSKTYLNPDGTFTTEITQVPAEIEKDDGGYRVDESPTQIDIGQDNNLLKITNPDNTSVEYNAATNKKLRPFKIGKNKIIYKNFAKGVSISYKIANGAVKEDIILHRRTSSNAFAFKLRLKGLKPARAKNGSIALLNKNNKTSLTIDKPFMIDSNKNPRKSYNVKLEIGRKNKSADFTLKVIADKKFLNDPKTTYPVKIDPTFLTSERLTDDTYIYEGEPNTTYATSDKLYVGAYADNKRFKTLLKYSLKTVPAQASITKAELVGINPIYGNNNEFLTNINAGSSYKGKTQTNVYKVTKDWNSTTANWTNTATSYDAASKVAAVDNFDDNQAFDVTNMVKGFQSSPTTNYGFMLENSSIVKIANGGLPLKAAGARQSSSWNQDTDGYFIPTDSSIVAKFNIQTRPSHLSFSLQNFGRWHTAYWGEQNCVVTTESGCKDFILNLGAIPSVGNQQIETSAASLGLTNSMISGLAFAALPTGEATLNELYAYRKLVFHSSKATDPGLAPRLVIDYTSNEYGRKGYKTYKDYSGTSTELKDGNLLVEANDLSIKGRGPSIAVSRTYNSYDKSTSRIFGKGFSSYPDSVRVDYNGISTAVLTTETGATWVYTQNADGSFTKPKGTYDELTKDANGIFTLKRRDLSRIEFDSFGRASKEIDKNSNTLTFTYDPAHGGHIKKITDASNREITFDYLTSDKVKSITDFANRTWTYNYNVPVNEGGDNTSDTLDRVVDPAGAATSYRYDSSGNLVGITNPLGQTENKETIIIYFDESVGGQVKSVANPQGNSISMSYTTSGVIDNSITKNELEVAYTHVTDPKGNKTTSYFNAEGIMTVTGEPEGSTVITPSKKPFFPGASIEREVMHEYLVYYTCYKKVWVEDVADTGADEEDVDAWLDSEEDEWEDAGEGDAISAGGHWVDVPDTCSRKEIDYKKENVWNKAWDPTFAAENIAPPEISQPLKHGTDVYYEYDANYNLIKLINKNKTFTTFEYGSSGNKTKEVNHDHEVSENETDYTNDPTRYSARHRDNTYIYDSRGLLLSQTSPMGNTTTYAYDEKGNLTSESSPLGGEGQGEGVTTYIYDSYGNQVTQTAPGGGVTTNTYDANANITQTTDAEGVSTFYTYDALGNKLTEQKEGMNEAKYTYDTMGRVKTSREPPNGAGGFKETEYIYDNAGNKTKEIEYQGQATTGMLVPKNEVDYEYNVLGQLTKEDITFAQTTTYTYDENGNKKTETKSNRGATSYEYDSLNRLIKETKPDSSWVAYAYDSFGNIVKTGTPEGTTVNLYDKAGNEIASGDQTGSVTKTTYDKEGNERSTADGQNSITGMNYDAAGNITTVTEAKDNTNASQTNYNYDANQNETKVVAPNNTATATDYNQASQVTKETDQNTKAIATSYNASGFEQAISQPNDMNQDLKYDSAGNNTEANAKGVTSTSTNISSKYDWKGNLDTAVTEDQNGNEITKLTSAIEYSNPENRIGSINDTKRTINYHYNSAGDVVDTEDPADPLGKTIYAYDGTVGKLTGVTDANSKTTSFAYDKEGKSSNISKINYPNSTTSNINYDAASKVTSLANKKGNEDISLNRYTYDKGGNITKTYTLQTALNDYFNDDFSVYNPVEWSSGNANAYHDPVNGQIVLQGSEIDNTPADSWLDNNWTHRASVLINNLENSQSLTDYQVKVEIDYKAGMKSDFSDLRFTDEDKITQIPYWIESKTNAKKATVWLKIPTIEAESTKLVYMYYGNPNAASASNGNSVYEFYDGFSTSNNIYNNDFNSAENSIGKNWVADSAIQYNSPVPDRWSISNNQLVSTYNGSVGYSVIVDKNFNHASIPATVDVDVYATDHPNGLYTWGGIWYKGLYFDITTRWGPRDNSENYALNGPGISKNTWHKVRLVFSETADGKTHYDSYLDGNLIQSRDILSSFIFSSNYIGVVSTYDGGTTYWKNYKVSTNTVSASVGQVTTSRSWLNEDWAKRAPLEINNTKNAETLTNYQVKMQVPYEMGMNNDFSDLRFTDEDKITELPYWIEEKTDGDKATVWIKVPNIAANSTKTIYMYYANEAAASAGDGSKVFDFFDDFSGASLNTGKWNQHNGNATSISGGLLTTSANNLDPGKLTAISAPTGDGYVMRSKFKVTAGSGQYERVGLSLKSDITSGQGYNYVLFNYPGNNVRFLNDWITWGNSQNFNWLFNSWYTEEIAHDGVNVLGRFNDDPWQSQIGWSGRTGYPALNIGSMDATSVWDWALVHKYTLTEPTVSLGKTTSIKNWFNEDWQKRASISIDNASNNQELAGYQIKIKVPYVQGLQSDFDDIRFTDEDKITPLNYWVEDKKLAESATVWIKVPKIKANEAKTIYMYYDNENAASESNGQNTFEMYDTQGIQAFYKFDEGSGTIAADQTETYNGTLIDNVSWQPNGKYSSAVKTAGNGYVRVPAIDIGNTWSIESWFLAPVPQPVGNWSTLTRGTNDHQVIALEGRDLGTFDNAGGTGFHNSGFNLTSLSSGWHHLVAVGTSAGNTEFYIDGAYKASSNFRSTTDIVAIGNYQVGTQPFGTIDEAKIYNRALTPTEISKLPTNFIQKMGDVYNARKYTSNGPKATLNLNWFNEDWLKRAAVTIDNTESSSALTDYQLKLNIDYKTGMQTDFSDIRFTDADHLTQLPYWIESKTDATQATVWVRVPEVKASSTKDIYMYYSNPNATSASSGDKTFKEYDIQGLKGFWKLDEEIYTGSAGEVIDQANTNHGTANNGIITTADSKHGKAAYFDGYDDYVSVPHNPSLNVPAVTVEAWVKMSTTSGNRNVVFKGDHRYLLQIRDGKVLFGSKSSSGSYSEFRGSLDVLPNTWTHIAITHDGSVKKMYVNGVLDPITQDQTGLYTADTNSLKIGTHNTLAEWFSGLIDEVKIYNKALSADEITTNYNGHTFKLNDTLLTANSALPAPSTQIAKPISLKDWYNPDFKDRAPITIENNNNKTLTDYQIKATIHYKDGMKSDFGDLRFTDNDKISELDYWIESKTDNTSATVWIKVPKITANTTKTLYMYYNNENATSQSNGNEVFEQFDVKNIKALYHLDDNFNGSSGDTKDETKTYNGTSKGSMVGTTDAKYNKAANFDGSNDTIELGNWMAYQNFSVSMWVNPSSSQVDYSNIIDNNHNNSNWTFEMNGNNPNQYYWWASDGTFSTINLGSNQWSYLTITRDSATKENKIYINGDIVATARGTSLINYDGKQFLRLSGWSVGGRYWKGKMDEVQIYDRAITDTEVATQYNNYTQKMGSVYNVRKTATAEPKVVIEANSDSKANALLTATKTISRDLYPQIKVDLMSDTADPQSLIATEGYSGKGHRLLGVINENGTLKVQVQEDHKKTTEAIAIKGVQVNDWYTAQFDYTPKDTKVYVYKKGDPKPAYPAFTYTDVSYNPNLVFENKNGKTVIDNVDIKTRATNTQYVYDDLNRLTKVSSPLGGEGQGEGAITSYSYDEQGNRLSRVSGLGSGVSETTTYTYSPANELLEARSSNNEVRTFTYDSNGNAISKVSSSAAESSSTFSSPLAGEGQGEGATTNYVYDNKNQLVKVSKLQQDTDNKPDKWQVSNLLSTDGRSAEYKKTGDYSLKIAGDKTKSKSIEQELTNTGKATDQLTFSGYNKLMGHNKHGNAIKATLTLNNTDGTTTKHTLMWPKTQHNWMKQSRNIVASKDFDGAVVKVNYSKEKAVAYFDDIKLTSQLSGLSTQHLLEPGFELNKDDIEYVYDAKGNRCSKTINSTTTGNTDTRYYHYDAAGNIVSETDVSNNVLVRYVRDTSGKAISMFQGASTYYFTYNGHGDVIALTDEQGNVVASYDYDEFGNPKPSTTNHEPIYNPIRYSGANNAYYDTETGLYKMGVRYYQSDVGRWLTRDEYQGEQEQPQSQNRYVYGENNPINNVDPTGHFVIALPLVGASIGILVNVLATVGAGVAIGYLYIKVTEHASRHGEAGKERVENTMRNPDEIWWSQHHKNLFLYVKSFKKIGYLMAFFNVKYGKVNRAHFVSSYAAKEALRKKKHYTIRVK